MTGQTPIAAVISTAELERLYSGLSLLVSAAADGIECRALAAFAALDHLLSPELPNRAMETSATPGLSWAGRDTFGRSLAELRDTALELEGLTIYACAAAVETMGLTAADLEGKLAGVLSTPRFLREAEDARLVVV